MKTTVVKLPSRRTRRRARARAARARASRSRAGIMDASSDVVMRSSLSGSRYDAQKILERLLVRARATVRHARRQLQQVVEQDAVLRVGVRIVDEPGFAGLAVADAARRQQQ